MQFDAKSLLVHEFERPQALCDRLAFFALPTPNVVNVQKWFERGSIPGGWLPFLLACLEYEKGSVSVRQYIRGSK